MRNHVFTAEELRRGNLKSVSPEGRRKYSETMAYWRAQVKEAVRELREEGMVPGAIADELGISDSRVRKCLTQLIAEGALEPVPRYLR